MHAPPERRVSNSTKSGQGNLSCVAKATKHGGCYHTKKSEDANQSPLLHSTILRSKQNELKNSNDTTRVPPLFSAIWSNGRNTAAEVVLMHRTSNIFAINGAKICPSLWSTSKYDVVSGYKRQHHNIRNGK